MSDSIGALGFKRKGASGTQVTEQRRRVAEARAFGLGQVKQRGALTSTNIMSFQTALNIQAQITSKTPVNST